MALFKKAVRKYNIAIGRSIFFPRFDPKRSKAICYNENCPWQIYCVQKTHPLSYQVKTFVDQHTCARNNKCKSANEKWVVDELEKKMRTHPALTVKEAEQFFREEYDVNVNERKIYRCIVKARERIEGSEKAQYSLLRDYGDEILRCNPSSTVIIETTPMPTSDNLFKRIYICLHACKKNFLGGFRPFICLDRTFQAKISWKWFLQLLQENLGDGTSHGFSFMSDQQKEFDAAMDRVKRMNPHACEYLRRIEPCQWSRSHFSEWLKSNNITNNNVEVFNGCIKKIREKPIITMLEEIRCYIMRILARNKKALVGYMGKITPVQQSRLEVEKRYSNRWRPFPTGDLAGNIFEVQCLPIKVSVDLGKKTCSCRFWQLNDLPCRHACAALAYQNRRPEEYANN
ncbi:uncharacterized protein [Arachis hypogaea]|uniref:uncharacterized protein n=1 Tax=Arachis hypogaea TaxID=3818 RepID=UPI000DED134F|nr:uncharacterized protein LOC112762850 [Arachis hypogaea]